VPVSVSWHVLCMKDDLWRPEFDVEVTEFMLLSFAETRWVVTVTGLWVLHRPHTFNSLLLLLLPLSPAAVGSERRCPSGDWYSTLRPYIAGAPSATLAISVPARPLQDGYVRSPVVVWRFAIVPGRRLPSCRRCSWAAAAFHSEPNMRCDADIQRLRRQSVLSYRPRTMEQSSIAPERRWLIVQWIPAVVTDISVWTVGPRRSVNFIN